MANRNSKNGQCGRMGWKAVNHQSIVCLMTSPEALPKRVLHRVQHSAFSFNFQYPLISLKSSSSCLHLPPQLPITSILPSIFPSITCFIRQFLRMMWPIQIAFLHLLYVWYSCLHYLCVILLHFSHDQSNWSFSILLQHHISKLSMYFWPTFRSIQVSTPYKAIFQI